MTVIRIMKFGSILGILIFASPVYALTYYLTQDLGVQGNVHLCKYSNGKVYSVNSIELCKLQIEDDGPIRTQGFTPSSQMGFLKGEYQDGMTKVCVYEVLGRKEAIRLNSYAICPINYNF